MDMLINRYFYLVYRYCIIRNILNLVLDDSSISPHFFIILFTKTRLTVYLIYGRDVWFYFQLASCQNLAASFSVSSLCVVSLLIAFIQLLSIRLSLKFVISFCV